MVVIGKVYKIIEKSSKIPIYVGSTIQTLEIRWKEHKKSIKCKNSKNRKIYKMIKLHGIQNYELIEIETVVCDSIIELRDSEKIWILKLNTINEGCNIQLPNKTRQKKLEHSRNYNRKHKKYINCFCGGRYTNVNMSQHKKTDLHKFGLLTEIINYSNYI